MIRGALLIARREFVERGRSRVFRGVLIATMLLIVGGMFVLTRVGPSGGTSTVTLAGEYPAGLRTTVIAYAEALDVPVTVTTSPSPGAAQQAVVDGRADAALVDGDTILAMGPPSAALDTILRGAATSSAQLEVAAGLGLAPDDLAQLIRPVDVAVVDVNPEGPPDDESVARSVAAFISVLLLFMALLIFGQFVGMGVVEEKQSRVAEIVLSKVSTATLLVGKVLGIGALGLAQVLAVGTAVVVGLLLFPPETSGFDVSSLGATAFAWIVLWFIVGFLMYSFLYATLGATVSRMEDLQSLAYIPSLLLLPPYFLVSLSIGGTLSPWVGPMSFVPFWSPLLMPSRILRGDAAAWEVLVALLGSALLILLLVRIGARVFRGAAMRSGGRVPLREAWRAG